MAQHFLLSAAARTLSLKSIFAEGEEAAYRRFCKLRWPETDGAPHGTVPVTGVLTFMICPLGAGSNVRPVITSSA
jgi:hypothetical protein